MLGLGLRVGLELVLVSLLGQGLGLRSGLGLGLGLWSFAKRCCLALFCVLFRTGIYMSTSRKRKCSNDDETGNEREQSSYAKMMTNGVDGDATSKSRD